MESILDLAYNTLASESIENIKSNNIINCSDSSNESTLLEKNNCMWHKQINSVYYFESAASEMNQVIDSITYSNSITSPASENIGKNNKGFNIVDSGSKEKCSLIEMNEDKGFLDKKTFDILNCQENDMENQEYNNVTNMINNIVDSDEDTNSSISSCKENGSQELKDLSGAIRFSDKKTSGILHCQENDMENEEYNNVTNMINNIVDSDEDSNSSIASCKENGALELKDLSGVINKKKMGSVRASKESAMQQIHSETQRLIRESHITLPYHRPKQRTLQEFLNRKKTNSILPPNLTCAERVKMFPQIVGKVVSKIETEAENFYTSSDSDNESIEQKKVDFTDAKSTNECHNSDTQNLIHKVLEKENDLLNIENTQNYVAKENDDLMNTSNEDNNFDKSKEVSTTTIIEKNSLLNMNETDSNSNDSKYLTSKLDIENNDISALSNLPTSQKDDKLYDKMGKSIKNLNMKTEYLSSITQIPTIKGSPGSIINLMDPNPINEGAARLLNRFIRHSKIKKCNHNDILEVKTLRTEGAKNDIKVIEEILPFTKVIDEDDDQRESRPGEKLLKLKKDLKRKISIAKTEEWKQKEMNNKEEESTCNDDESYKNLPDEYDIESAESDESGLEENDVTMEDKVSKKCKFLNEEAEESDADDGEQSNEYEDEEQINNEDSDEYEETEEIETENETVQTAYKKQKNLKRIIIPADDDSNHSESSLNKTNEDTFNLQTNSNYINEIDDVDNISLFQPQGCNGLDSRNQICKTPLLTSNNVFSMISPVTHLTVLNTVTDSAKKLSFNSAECTPTDERNEKQYNMEKVVGLQKKLFDDPSYTVTDDEILAVCSGKFTNTQGSQNLKKHGSLNQTSELMELCSGAFFTQLVDMKKLEVPKCNNQISDNSSQDIVLTFDEEINLEGSAEPSSLVKQFSNSILNSDSSSENNSKNLMGESLEMANQTPINMQLIKKGDIAESQLLDKVSNKITSPLVKTLVTNIAHSNKSNDTPLASINQSMNLIKQVNGEQDSDCLKYFKVASSSDDDEEAEKSQSERKILKKRKVQKLVLSDDEADNPTRSSEESETEHAEDFLGYDSDENEIKLSKREINQEASKFLENEAELSESDWDSADENEEDMDRLEYEDGDADEIDEDIVKNQLDRLHMKQQMDDDKREVRMLQELLFDDGDLYSEGVSRQKRFKWKNINDSEDLNESNVNNDPAEEIHTEVDTAYEIEMRKLRHEKQKFLEDKEKRFGELIEEDFNDSQLIKSKLKIVSARSLSSNLKEEQNVLQFHLDNNCETTNKTSITLDASSCTEKLSFSNVRGSFLARGNDTLVRIAQNLPETSKNSLNLKSRGNFVFEHISPSVTRSTNKNSEQGNTNTPRHKGRKRKFTLNQTPRTAKKLKTDEKIRGNKLF